MGLPPGEIAPGPGPVAAAEELAGPASIDETAGPDKPVAVNGPVGMPAPGGSAGPGSVVWPGSAEGAAGTDGVGALAGARRPVVPRARPSTGDPRVDDAVARLDDLAGLPLAEHLAVFEYVHELLTEALGDLEVHAPARAGDQTHAPGAPGG